MKHSLYVRKGVMPFFLFFLLTVGVSSLQATCPTDIPPLTGPGHQWLGGFSRNFAVTGTNCVFRVFFCKRTVNGEMQFYIEKIEKVSGNCTGLKWVDIMNDFKIQLMLADRDVEPCGPNPPVVTSVYTGQCVSFIFQNGIPALNFCSDGAYCKKTCDLCWDITNGTFLQNCTTTIINVGDCDALTEINDLTVDQIEQDIWNGDYGHCYFIGCTEEE